MRVAGRAKIVMLAMADQGFNGNKLIQSQWQANRINRNNLKWFKFEVLQEAGRCRREVPFNIYVAVP